MKNIIKLSLSFLLIAGFSSCLKDKTIIGPDSPGAITHIIEFLNPSTISSGITLKTPTYVKSYDISPAGELEITVSYSGGGGAPNDIMVKVALDNSAITAVNKEQELTLSPLPQNLFSIPSLDITIPKGAKTASFKVTVKPDQFDFSEDYAMGFKIESVTGTNSSISGNFGKIVVLVGAKNKLDGEYKVTGSMVDIVASNLTGLYPATYYLITQTGSSVAMYDPTYFGDYIHLIKNGTAVSGYGSFSPLFTFDADGKITKIQNAYGQPAGNGRSAQIDPTGVNKIDANGNFKVKYFMFQPGTTLRTSFDETFTRVGARP